MKTWVVKLMTGDLISMIANDCLVDELVMYFYDADHVTVGAFPLDKVIYIILKDAASNKLGIA